MFPPTPFSLLCAILLCFPLAVLFTFSFTTTPAVSPNPTPSNLTIASGECPLRVLLPPGKTLLLKPQLINNNTAAAISAPSPPASHPTVEDDGGDVSLLELASRVDPNPKPVKKLAFLFLATSSLPLAPLWELYFSRASSNLYNIYVHADPRVNHTAAFLGVFSGRVIPSKPTRRHTPTLISAARRLLANALLHDESNSMFLLLSPSCIPLHSFHFTRNVLVRSRRSFIEILRNEPGAFEKWSARGVSAMLPELEFADFRIGSQFWALRRRHAAAVVQDTRLWSKFRLPCLDIATCYPEEQYFPTLLSMVDPLGCVPCTLTHVNWKGGHGGHPRMYRPDEVGRGLILGLRKCRPRYGDEEPVRSNSTGSLRSRPGLFLFARKFSPATLHGLMSISEDLFKD